MSFVAVAVTSNKEGGSVIINEPEAITQPLLAPPTSVNNMKYSPGVKGPAFPDSEPPDNGATDPVIPVVTFVVLLNTSKSIEVAPAS